MSITISEMSTAELVRRRDLARRMSSRRAAIGWAQSARIWAEEADEMQAAIERRQAA